MTLMLLLVLAVGVALGLESRALEAGAAHVLLPSDTASQIIDDLGVGRTAAAAAQQDSQAAAAAQDIAAPQDIQSDHSLRNHRNLAAAGTASSQPSPGAGSAGAGSSAAARTATHPTGLSRAQAVALVQRRYRARVVRAHLLRTAGGRRLYVLRLLSASGTVYTVRLDPTNGAEVP